MAEDAVAKKNSNKERSSGGRHKKWEALNIKDKLDSVRGWSLHGSTDVEIAKMLGVSKTVLYEWKNEYPEFAEAIKKGKEIANGEILNSAFKQATGFYVTEQMAVKVRTNEEVPTADGKGTKWLPAERVEVVDVIKFVPANSTMAIFMLKNRLPTDYKDKQVHEHLGAGGGPVIFKWQE